MDAKDGGIANLLEDIMAGPEKFAASRSAMGGVQDNSRAVEDLTGAWVWVFVCVCDKIIIRYSTL